MVKYHTISKVSDTFEVAALLILKVAKMAGSTVARITTKNTALFLCDMQEKFRKTISFYPQILAVSGRMLKSAQILDVPVVVTEQYPKG